MWDDAPVRLVLPKRLRLLASAIVYLGLVQKARESFVRATQESPASARRVTADYAVFNRLYAEYFEPDRLPARTTVGVTFLARGGIVEVDLIARLS